MPALAPASAPGDGGRVARGGSLGKPSGPQRETFPSQLCTPARGSSALYLGLQLCQPGLTLQKVSLELTSATLKLHLCGQELSLVFCAWQQALHQGLRKQRLHERVGDVPGDRDSAKFSYL